MADNPKFKRIVLRLGKESVEAFERIRAIDPDLSMNQVAGRVLRIYDRFTKGKLSGEALAKYNARELGLEEYQAAIALFNEKVKALRTAKTEPAS